MNIAHCGVIIMLIFILGELKQKTADEGPFIYKNIFIFVIFFDAKNKRLQLKGEHF